MTFRATASFTLVLAALAAGCAADPQSSTAGSGARAEPVYRTGSNIPVREPGRSTEEQRARAPADAEAQKPSGTSPKTN